MTRVLLTEHAIDTLSPRLEQLPVMPIVLDGRIDAIDVAWASSDVFRSRETTRHFFGAARSSQALQWLHTSAAGVDHPIFAELFGRGVTLTTSHVNGPPIAEYVMRAVLDWFQRADEWRAAAQKQEWRAHEFREVLGTTWLVIGLGSIGTEVAVRARAFGAHVIGTRRTPRGDEPALVAALDRGIPEAALLDVACIEPLPADSPLWTHPRVVMTAHSSGLGEGRHGRAATVFYGNLTRFLAGDPMMNVVADTELIG